MGDSTEIPVGQEPSFADEEAQLEEELRKHLEEQTRDEFSHLEVNLRNNSTNKTGIKGLIEDIKNDKLIKSKRDPTSNEIADFIEQVAPLATVYDYPSPSIIVGLAEVVYAVNSAFGKQIELSGYHDFKNNLAIKLSKQHPEKTAGELGLIVSKELECHDLRRFYELDFDKNFNPDAFLNEAIVAFNHAKASLYSLYERNGVFATFRTVADWIAKFSYGIRERQTIKELDGKESTVGLVNPHSVEYAKKKVRDGASFLIESAINQLAKFPKASARTILEYKQVEGEKFFTQMPVLTQVYDKTVEQPMLAKDFDVYGVHLGIIADLLDKTSNVLEDLSEHSAGAVHNSVKKLEELVLFSGSRLPDKTEINDVITGLYETLANIAGIPFDNAKAYSLGELEDESIALVLRASELYHQKLSEAFAVEPVPVGQPYFVEVADEHRKLLGTGLKKENKESFSRSVVKEWISSCLSDKQFMLSAYYAEHPWSYVAQKLESFGIPEFSAREFENLMNEHFFRGRNIDELQAWSLEKRVPKNISIRCFDDSNRVFDAEVYSKVLSPKNNIEFSQGLKFVMEQLSGKSLPAFYACGFVKNDENLSKSFAERWHPRHSNGIWTEALVYGHDKAGNLLEVDRRTFHEGDTAELKRCVLAYPEHELYVGGNMGVAWILDIDMGWPKNPTVSKIELLDDKWDDKESAIDNLVKVLQVSFHETRHIGQIGSRLKWRYVGAAVAEFFAQYVLEKYDAGALDKEGSFTDFSVSEMDRQGDLLSSKLAHPVTYREHVLKWFNVFNAQAFGVGKRAELLRKYGPHKGALFYDENGNVQNPEKFAVDSKIKGASVIAENALNDVIDTVPWECSKTARLIGRTFNAIANLETDYTINPESRKTLENLMYECRKARQEFSTIIETDAEVSGLYCTKEVLSKAYQDDSAKVVEAETAWNKKYNALIKAGEAGRKAFEIISKPIALEEKQAELKPLGVRYDKIYDGKFASQTVIKNLRKLGFEETNNAYDCAQLLEERLNKVNMSWNDVLAPTNFARIDVQRRYRQHIPDFMSVVETHGYAHAVQIFENAECVDDVVKCK
ncbi:hypothetical protein HY485_02310 [Candidatus Woesearchaeota archaeon]|nr:hypothetical protein [Candidatus Woesearchaeota archaeon]